MRSLLDRLPDSIPSRRGSLFRMVVAAGAALLVSSCTYNPAPPPSSAPPPPAAEREHERERRNGNAEADLASMMNGRWEGVTPGNHLVADVQSAGFRSLSHPYDLFLEISGSFDDVNVRQQGYIHLESQGRGVYLGYIPHFDPTVTALSPRAGRFTSSETSAACSLSMEPRGDGFDGGTEGPTCALAIRGAIGSWTLRVEPGSMVVRSATSGETLRFRRVTGS